MGSADCDLRGFWDFGVVNFGAFKRAISFFSSVFFACTPCKVSFVISFSGSELQKGCNEHFFLTIKCSNDISKNTQLIRID